MNSGDVIRTRRRLLSRRETPAIDGVIVVMATGWTQRSVAALVVVAFSRTQDRHLRRTLWDSGFIITRTTSLRCSTLVLWASTDHHPTPPPPRRRRPPPRSRPSHFSQLFPPLYGSHCKLTASAPPRTAKRVATKGKRLLLIGSSPPL